MKSCQYQKTTDGQWYCPVCDPQQDRTLEESWTRDCHPKRASTGKSKKITAVIPHATYGPGTELKKLLHRFGIRPTSNCKCNKRALIMDQRGPDWCEENAEKILGWLAEESKRRGFPFVKAAGRMLIKRAIHNSRKRQKKSPPKAETDKEEGVRRKPHVEMKWAYGVTTVPSRLKDLLPQTLASLKAGGFLKPRLFVDGVEDVTEYKKFGLEITNHNPPIKTFGNWVLTLWELYLREPLADRYAIFQDDFVTYKNLRQYLEKCVYTRKTYWNLYTFPVNQKLAPKGGKTGWFEANQLGKGAVALVFDRETVTTLLGQDHMLRRPQGSGPRKYRAVDGAVVTALRKAGWKEHTHNPSLVQHTGVHSSMGNRKQQLSESFRGEDFDATELLK